MKFHKQLKVPGLNEEQIIEALESTGMKMRPMREEYYGQKKFKPTNTMNDFVIVVADNVAQEYIHSSVTDVALSLDT